MDQAVVFAVWNAFLVFVVPFMAFAVGVFISDVVGLNEGESRRNVYLMALPVGLLTVGILLQGTTVRIDLDAGLTLVRYGHMQGVGLYLVFCGTIMFYGTLVPQLFRSFRERLRDSADAGQIAPPQNDG